jgi:hypothetical protein
MILDNIIVLRSSASQCDGCMYEYDDLCPPGNTGGSYACQIASMEVEDVIFIEVTNV